MKLVFVTQVLDRDDAVLGFVPRWIEGLARAAERVRVVALEVGNMTRLPDNVDVREIGRNGRVRRYLRFRSALGESFRDGFDGVLAHMVPRYALLAAGPARRAGARTYLWYTHGTVDDRLRRAERVVEKIFTASPESMRLETPKVVVTGHGVDLIHFDSGDAQPTSPPRILSVGRLTPAKDPLTLVAAVASLVGHGREVLLDLVGGGLAAGDEAYVQGLRTAIAQSGLGARVTLHGPVPYGEVAPLFSRATVCVNASLTGSLDKVVLEAMAAGRPVLSCNDSFPALVSELGPDGEALFFPRQGAARLAERLGELLDRTPAERAALGARLRGIVARDHEVDDLMRRLVEAMSGPR